MSAKIFISCGQRTKEEIRFANEIKKLIRSKGYEPALSSDMHTLKGVNECLIAEMEKADYYLFVDLKREKIEDNKKIEYRGSLYTHQELAWAYLLKLDNVIFLQQEEKGFRSEGLLAYWLNNPIKFKNLKLDNGLKKNISQKMAALNWNSAYSRHFEVGLDKKPKTFFIYEDHSGKMNQYIWLAEINNLRNDKPARNCTAVLWKINDKDSPDKSNLKWAGRKEAYTGFIRPNDSIKLDLFAISYRDPYKVYLHTDTDVYPREPIKNKKGIYKLAYRIYADDFPMKEFTVRLEITGKWSTTKASLLRK